jgi:hypothetical protein
MDDKESIHRGTAPQPFADRHGVPVIDGGAFARCIETERREGARHVIARGNQTAEELRPVRRGTTSHRPCRRTDCRIEIDAILVRVGVLLQDLDREVADSKISRPRRVTPARAI